MSTTTAIQLFPVGYNVDEPNQDNVDDATLFIAVNLDNGALVGEIGVMAPADTKYGYDSLWGWVVPNSDGENGKQSDSPFRSLSDAFENFLVEVSE